MKKGKVLGKEKKEVRSKKQSKARLILILIDSISILVILTNTTQYRYDIDTSGIVAKPGLSLDYYSH
jgi:hypothetical protein